MIPNNRIDQDVIMKKGFVIRELKFEDFNDLIGTYFSYYKELEGNPNLGLTLFKKKPSLQSEVSWFKDFIRSET